MAASGTGPHDFASRCDLEAFGNSLSGLISTGASHKALFFFEKERAA
jgi:hypothetical protein